MKEIDDGFGIGQQSAAEKGVRNIGVDGRAQISEQFFFDGEASWQQNLETDAIRNTARAQIRYENNGLTAATGLVHASDEFSDAETLESNLAEVSIAKKLGKITLRAGGSFELSDAARTIKLPMVWNCLRSMKLPVARFWILLRPELALKPHPGIGHK